MHEIRREIANLFPGYFALVMATGIISLAAHLLGMEFLARALLIFNAGAYVILWILTLFRLVCYFPRLSADLLDHGRGPGFFTVIAATCVLGSQLFVVAGRIGAARLLWLLGILLWLIVMYTFFLAVTVRTRKPSLETGINGAWLIAAVATQSVSVLGTHLSTGISSGKDIVVFFSLCMFLLGCMLYLAIITLIFYRLTFVRLTSTALTPPYWINMGAVAISTLAGATLILKAGQWPLIAAILPFLKGFTLFFWAAGTWWIPLLFLLGIWRHLHQRFPLKYDPQYWGMVFPLGMYTACTHQLASALEADFLLAIPRGFFFIALAAWVATLAGLLSSLYRLLFGKPGAQQM